MADEVLAAAAQIIDGPTDELLVRLSAATADLIPHRAVAQLASQCASTPVTTHGEPSPSAQTPIAAWAHP